MEIKSIFGENLKRCRKAKKLSQEQLSEQVDISVKHLSALERGVTFVSAELLERLAVSLEVPAFYFFVHEPEIFCADTLLNRVDAIIENRLVKVINEIKSDIRQTR